VDCGDARCEFLFAAFHSRFISEESSQNGAFYHDATVDRLLDQAAVCVDEPRRLALYRQVEQKLVSEGTLIVLATKIFSRCASPGSKGRCWNRCGGADSIGVV